MGWMSIRFGVDVILNSVQNLSLLMVDISVGLIDVVI